MHSPNSPINRRNLATSVAPRRSSASGSDFLGHERNDQYVQQHQELEGRANSTTAQAGRAFERLLALVESGSDAVQVRIVATFLATVVGLHRFDIYDLRALDVDLSDDVLVCMDAVRWGKCHLADLVPDGFSRAQVAAAQWGFVNSGPTR